MLAMQSLIEESETGGIDSAKPENLFALEQATKHVCMHALKFGFKRLSISSSAEFVPYEATAAAFLVISSMNCRAIACTLGERAESESEAILRE
ncbi:hypothetical protein WN943_024292 [Citrus x changshan-huyou]